MPRKSIGPQAMSPAERKREQRTRDQTTVMETPSGQWSARICLYVLQSARYGDALKAGAWRQLGRLNGWEV